MFDKFHLRIGLNEAINKLGFNKPTTIQEKVIPLAIRNKNIIGISRTGSGKTHSFLIPIFQNIRKDYKAVQAIIIAPTRELASQIFKMSTELSKLGGFPIKISLLNGGEDINKQIQNLTVQPHIVIGTPTRIHQLYSQGHLQYTTAKTVVIDEADMTMDLGFFDIVDELMSKTNPKCQKMVFSATLTEQIAHHLGKYIKNANTIKVDDIWVHQNTSHEIFPAKGEKDKVLLQVINSINPYMCIIFANSKKQVAHIQTLLINSGVDSGMIHGGLEARDRKNKFREIRDLKYKFLVASDIAARGVDIPGVSHIIHYELPMDDEWYIHRSGRAGRGDLTGKSIILYDDEDKKIIERLKRKGIQFIVKKITSDGIKESSLKTSRKRKQVSLADREVNELYKRTKQKKIKPGYKRKLRAKASKIRKKHKRAVIEEQIRANLKRKWVEESKSKKMMEEE